MSGALETCGHYCRPVRACARERTALLITWMGPALTGGLGGPSRTARATTRAKVRPPMCPLTRAGLSCECNTLTRFCARDAQTTSRSSTPPPPSSSPVSILRSPLPPHRLPLACRAVAAPTHDLGSRSVRCPGPGSDSRRQVCADYGGCVDGGYCGRQSDAAGPSRSASVRTGTRPHAALYCLVPSPRTLKPSKMVSRVGRRSNGRVKRTTFKH